MQLRIRFFAPGRGSTASEVTNANGRQATGTASAKGGGAALRVATGILISRVIGLVRERVIAHYFGNSAVADAFRAAIRIPNLLNNLFGEGVLSASFVTVYSKLRAQDRNEEAERLAGAVFGLLALVCAIMVALGVLLTPWLIDAIAPGFSGETRHLTIRMVRILFPGTGMLVMSAWCLGILNSHRRFLLSYMAPVTVSATMIAALLILGPKTKQDTLAIYLVWSSVLGCVLQFLVQLPQVLRFLPHFRPVLERSSESIRTVFGNFGPIFLSRGVVQISAYIDSMIASLMPTGAVAALGYGQIIALLPVSLFSMSVSAAELPALSSALGTDEEVSHFLRRRLEAGLRRIAYFVVPSAVAFLFLGDIVAGALYQSGRFQRSDTLLVWAVLAGSSVGLLATSLGRLYSSAFYALYDTRTPLRFAIIRVVLTTILGFLSALWLPRAFGIDARWGIGGLAASAGIAGWVEFSLLRHSLSERIGKVSLSRRFLITLWAASLAGAALAYGVKMILGTGHPLVLAIVALGLYGLVYLGATYAFKIAESQSTIRTALNRLGIG